MLSFLLLATAAATSCFNANTCSAEYTAAVPYAVSTHFFPGVANAIEIPVIGGAATLLSNFVLDSNNRLKYTGECSAPVAIKAKFSFGAQQPSQVDPTAPLDFGPKAITYGWIQVGTQKSVPLRLDQTLYYPPFEWPFILYSLDVDHVFQLNTNDVLQFFAYYDWRLAPAPPVDASTYYLTLNQVSLSWVVNSNNHPDDDTEPGIPLEADTTVNLGIGASLNTKVYEWDSGMSGKTLIHVRMNIGETTLYVNSTNAVTPVINTNWYAYLAINGVLQPSNLIYQTITNQPNIFNGDTVWPSTLELYMLSNLATTDKISVIVNIKDVLAPKSTPPFFSPVPDGGGVVTSDLDFKIIMTAPNYPDALVTPLYYSTVLLPVDGELFSAIEFPLIGSTVQSYDDSTEFTMENGKLIYRGHGKKRFKVRVSLTIDKLLLQNSDLDPAITVLQDVGLAVGVNGVAYNTVETFDNMYSDSRYAFKWLATRTAANVVRVKPGDEISVLVYTNNIRYLNVPPHVGTTIPNKVPPDGSKVIFTAAASLVIE
jgi:hypothetical protein